MPTSEEARRKRAATRRSWPIRVFRLGEEEEPSPLASTTAEERLAMVWQITVDTWELSGRTIPVYPRHETPLRVIRPKAGSSVGGSR